MLLIRVKNKNVNIGLKSGNSSIVPDLQGAVSRDFLPLFFFHESNPSGPLINRLKYFFLKIRFRQFKVKKFQLRAG